MEPTIMRYGEPGEHDHAPYKSTCKRSNNRDGEYEIYVQTSLHEEKPVWILVGKYSDEISEQDVLADIDATLMCNK